MSEHKLLAKITDTFLGWEDHGIFTAMIGVDYEEGGHQGIGLHCLGGEKHGYDMAGGYIAGLLAAVGVDKWEALPGKMIYVLSSKPMTIGSKEVLGIQGLGFRGAAKRFVFEEWQASVAELVAHD